MNSVICNISPSTSVVGVNVASHYYYNNDSTLIDNNNNSISNGNSGNSSSSNSSDSMRSESETETYLTKAKKQLKKRLLRKNTYGLSSPTASLSATTIALKTGRIAKRQHEKRERKQVLEKLREMVGGNEDCTQLEVIQHVIDRIYELQEKLNRRCSTSPSASSSTSSITSFDLDSIESNNVETINDDIDIESANDQTIRQLIFQLSKFFSFSKSL